MQKRILFGVLLVLGFIFTLNFVSTVNPVCGDGDCEVGESCYIDCQYEYPNVTRDPISYKSLNLTNRSLYSNRYYNSTGNYYVLELHPAPVNYNNGSEFVPINTTILSENCEFDYCVRKGLYYADFKNSSTANNTVKFLYNESNISYTPIELKYVNGSDEELISNVQQVQGNVNGSSFTYSGIYGSGFDLEYSYRNVLLKKTLQISSQSDLPAPSLQNPDLRLAFKFSKDGDVQDKKNNITWDEVSTLKVSGRADIVDSENDTLFYLLSPIAIDNNNSILKLNYTFENIGGDLIVSVSVPYSWLTNETRVYPISIDPSTVYLDPNFHGWVTRDENNFYIFFISDIFNFFRAGFREGNPDERYRSYVLWFTDISIELDPEDIILNVDLAWEVIGGILGPGIDNDIMLFSIDKHIPGNILIPDTQDEMAQLYTIINEPPFLAEETDVQSIGSYTTPLNSVANTELEDRVDTGGPFIMGFVGECCNPNDGFVAVNGVGSVNVPFLIVQIQSAPVCGNGIKEEGEQCDGDDLGGATCESLGFGGGTLDCNVDCTFDTNQCTPLCGIPDGSGPDCDCNNDDDCPENWICDQEGSGQYDACIPEPICSGTIAVITEDSSSNPLQNLYVYLNTIQQGQTDALGSFDINLQDQTCGALQTVETRCDDDTTVCDTQYTSMDNPNDPDYDSLLFTCDICLPELNDLFIETDDIAFADDQAGNINVSVTVHTINIEASNVEVDITRICDNGDFTDTEIIPTVTSSNDYVVSIVVDLSDCSLIRAHVDPDNEIDEGDNEENNEAEQFVIDPVDVYLNINTGYSLVDDKIKDFIDDFAQSTSQADAQIEIFVGRVLAPPRTGEYDWGLEDNVVYYNGIQEGVPYNGLVGKRFIGNTPRLYVFGTEIDGTIAAVRRLIQERVNYLNENHLNEPISPTYLGETDIDAISVFDYMHTDENQADYRINNNNFANIVDNVLRKQTFTLAIKRVQTSNDATVLRLKNINQELSPAFRNFTNERPVVLANQLFGNLFSMEELGLKIARDDKFNKLFIRDAWLAEMTGGPNTDCDLCPNYDYNTLIDFYWPALIGGVIQYTGEPQVDYVGYSSSGGVGIKSFDKYVDGKSGAGLYLDENDNWLPFNLPANSVDHMALIAPMGAFDGNSTFVECIDKYGDDILNNLQGQDHIDRVQIADEMVILAAAQDDGVCEVFATVIRNFPSEKISYNFWNDIVDDVHDKTNINPSLSSINKLITIRGTSFVNPEHDLVVPKSDIDYMYDNSNANQKYNARIFDFHIEMQNFFGTYNPLTSKFLNNVSYSPFEEFWYDIESG